MIWNIEGARDHSFKKFRRRGFFSIDRAILTHRSSNSTAAAATAAASTVAVAASKEEEEASMVDCCLLYSIIISLVCCYRHHRVCVCLFSSIQQRFDIKKVPIESVKI